MNRKTSSDVYDINHKTGALIIGKNRLDDYATKFLNKYCEEALTKPMAIPVEEIIEKMGLNIIDASLSANLDIYGCCLLLDSEIKIYDKENDIFINKHYPKGTILVDSDSEELYGNGSMRNTLIHEAIHWEKDRKFFDILELKNRKVMDTFYPIMCRKSDELYEPSEKSRTKKNQIYWLEWQAVMLAPRILMPKEMCILKAMEIAKSNKNNRGYNGENLITELSDFFKVSKISAKYRVMELDITSKLEEYIDTSHFTDVESRVKEYIRLKPEEAYKLVKNNQNLKVWIEKGNYCFIDGYFVKINPEYIELDNGNYRLSKKVKRNLSKYVVNIKEYRYLDYQRDNKNISYAYLLKYDGVDKRVLAFHPSYQGKILENEFESKSYDEVYKFISKTDDSLIEFESMLGNVRKSLSECLWYIMRKRGWISSQIFNEETGLYENLHGDIKNNRHKGNNLKRDSLMAICIGLKLDLRIIYKVFEKANLLLNPHSEPDKTYIKILDHFPGIPMQDFNGILESGNLKPLGSEIR